MGLLSLAIWTPIFFGAVLLAFGRDEHAGMVRWIALIGALAALPIEHWTASTGARVFFVPSPSIPMLDINLDVVWETVQTALPALLKQLPAVRGDAADDAPSDPAPGAPC